MIDASLLDEAIASGDRDTIGRLLYQLAGILLSSSRLPPGLQRSDVAQDCVVAAWSRLDRADPRRGKVVSYLAQAMRFAIRHQIRKSNAHPHYTITDHM